MILDVRTIYMCIFVGNLFTVILMSAYNKDHKDKAVDIFLLGKWAEIIGFLFVSFRGLIPDIVSYLIGNILILNGSGIETIAILILLKKWGKVQKKVFIFILLLSTLSYSLLLFLGTDDWIRIIQASTTIILLLTYPTFILLRSKNKSMLIKVTGILYCIIIISMLFRVVDAFLYKETMKLMTNNVTQSISILGLLISMIVISYGFLLIAKENADTELKNAAMFDYLTGILNRRSFLEMVKRLLNSSKRKEQSCAFIMMDIDFFKKVNDTYGHIAGDQVLKDFASSIKTQLRESDLFCRYGGEEFAVFLSDVNETLTKEISERLRLCIENSNYEIKYTISSGISMTKSGEKDTNQMYKEADLALYEAKKTGRNRVIMFNQLS